MSEHNTPPGMEPSPDGVNPWVQYQLIRILDKMRAVELKVDTNCSQIKELNEFKLKTEVRLAEGVSTFKYMESQFKSIDEQIKELRAIRNSGNSKNNDGITFQWVLEKLALPVIMLIIGGAIALLFN